MTFYLLMAAVMFAWCLLYDHFYGWRSPDSTLFIAAGLIAALWPVSVAVWLLAWVYVWFVEGE